MLACFVFRSKLRGWPPRLPKNLVLCLRTYPIIRAIIIHQVFLSEIFLIFLDLFLFAWSSWLFFPWKKNATFILVNFLTSLLYWISSSKEKNRVAAKNRCTWSVWDQKQVHPTIKPKAHPTSPVIGPKRIVPVFGRIKPGYNRVCLLCLTFNFFFVVFLPIRGPP